MLEGVKNISAIQPLWLKIQTPERTFAGRYLLCTVSNSTSVGGIFRFKRDLVSFNDGLFELVLIKAPKDLIELSILAADLLVSNEKTPLCRFCMYPRRSSPLPRRSAGRWTAKTAASTDGYTSEITPAPSKL